MHSNIFPTMDFRDSYKVSISISNLLFYLKNYNITVKNLNFIVGFNSASDIAQKLLLNLRTLIFILIKTKW